MNQHGVQDSKPATPASGRNSDELQSDVREVRSRMDETLDHLSAKLEPKRLVDEAFKSINHGEGQRFIHNLSESISRNPLPVLMIASGIGYMMYNDRAQRSASAGEGQGAPQPGSLHGMDSAAGESRGGRLDAVRERANQASERMKDKAHALSSQARNTKDEAANRAAMLRAEAERGKENAVMRGQQVLQDQPLVLAGIGLAVGAAMAGTAPMSRREQRLMGEPMGKVLDRAEHAVQEEGERARQVAAAAGQAAKQELGKHYPQYTEPNRAADVLRETTERGLAAAKAAGRSARDEVHRQVPPSSKSSGRADS